LTVILIDAWLMDPEKQAVIVHERLLNTYGEPTWVNPMPPIAELVSTILSQNTNDINRDRAYRALRRRFPTWEEVRDADPNEIIEAIRSGGLANRKGPRIKQILEEITDQCGSLDLDFLYGKNANEARDWLLQFTGIGPKTASIVLLFSLNMPAFPVDTHIYRVTGRLGLRPKKMDLVKTHQYLASLFPPQTYYSAHLNIIRLGREICTARKPNCPACPLQDVCAYYKEEFLKQGSEPNAPK
jgi:endonuclease-3